jgi:hypothetical protein
MAQGASVGSGEITTIHFVGFDFYSALLEMRYSGDTELIAAE